MGLSFQEKGLWLMLISLGDRSRTRSAHKPESICCGSRPPAPQHIGSPTGTEQFWSSLLVGGFGFYFGTVLPMNTVNVMPQQVVLFVLALVMLVIVQVVGHIVIAIVDRRTEADERDRLIALKGTRNGAYVLAQLVETGSQLFLYRWGA